mmetsp:Transcript_6641/g.25643  ORF Transcript_6641/g.25643 Transcript_6641/m.25643 type:complete len:103 (-) Transcript_6641:80-388(-)
MSNPLTELIKSFQPTADEIDEDNSKTLEIIDKAAKRILTDLNTPWRQSGYWMKKEPLEYSAKNRNGGGFQGTSLGKFNDIDGFIIQCEINEAEMNLYRGKKE